MTRKFILSILVACFTFASMTAQSIQNTIPKDATFVLTLNPSVLNSKIKFSKLKEFDFVQMGIKEMTKEAGPMAGELKKFIDDPAQFGLDVMSSSYLFGKIDGEDMYFGMAMKIGEKAKFDELIQNYIAAMMPVQKEFGMEFIAPDDEFRMAWNGSHILLVGAEVKMNDNEDYDAFKERKKTTAQNWFKSLATNNKANSIASHPKFKMANVNNDDVNFWMDYSSFQELVGKMQGNGGDPMQQMMMGMMEDYYKDTYLSTGLNFDKGAVNLNSRYFMNDKMMDIYKKVSDGSFNKNFLKYIPRDNLGYYSFNFNFKNLVDLIKTSDNPMLAQYPVYESMAVEGLKSIGLEMTADDIYNLWKGDMMFAVTGMKEFEKEVTTYEFDDDFNKKEKKEMKKETLPEFVFMMSHGNKDNVLKLIDFGKQSSMISEEKGYFQIAVPDLPMDVYMKVHGDMIVVSNNKTNVTKKAKKLIKKKNRLKASEALKITNSSQIGYLNIPGVMDAMQSMEGSAMSGPEATMFNMGKDSFKSLEFSAGKKVGSSADSIFSLNFNNANMNSLEQIFNMINDAFMQMGGGNSM